MVAVGGGASSVLRDSQQAGSRQTESWVSENLSAVLLSDLTRYLERLVVVNLCTCHRDGATCWEPLCMRCQLLHSQLLQSEWRLIEKYMLV